MAANSYNAYYLGVQIGIARVEASLMNDRAVSVAWKSLDYAKENARYLHSVDLISSTILEKLTGIERFFGQGDQRYQRSSGWLLEQLEKINENFEIMESPYNIIYYFGFWIGIAEAQASTGDPRSTRHKDAALRKAIEYASQLPKGYGISPNEISIDADHARLTTSRENWGERFRDHA